MLTKCLEPKAWFQWFEAITQVPRGSHREAKIIAFLEKFFADRGIPYEVDRVGNVFVRLPATPGYEEQPAVLFQAHVDMVCRKDAGVEFDFDNDPIDLVIEGNELRAKGTTLGADNAVGVATMLAIADDPSIAHPALELLFTVCEEQGMIGIKSFDFSKIKARRMVNMDCGDSHVIAICSTGKIAGKVERPFELTPVTPQEKVLSLRIWGGLSGHASLCANKGRCCAANAMGHLLLGTDARLCSLFGTGAIIKECSAEIAVPADEADRITKQLQDRFAQFKLIYEDTDPDVALTVTAGEAAEALSQQQTHQTALITSLLRTGQITAEGTDPTSVKALSTVSQVRLKDGLFKLDYIIRSTCEAEQERIYEYYCHMAAALGFCMTVEDRQPVWPEKPSCFREKFCRVHKELFGGEPEQERVPGGIEVVHIVKNIPDMEPVGVAPTARGAHTTNEHLYISEVQPFWELIKAVLADKE